MDWFSTLQPAAVEVTWPTILTSTTLLTIFYLTALITYRRHFHPLRNIPGPFLPSVTWLYCFYFNLLGHSGQYYKEIERLHSIYGPIVRITPNEVHVSGWSEPSAESYDKVYTTNLNTVCKDPDFYSVMSFPGSVFGTIPNDLHRKRRALLSPFFLGKAILAKEDVVHEKVDKLRRRIQSDIDASSHQRKGSATVPTDLYLAFRAISLDVITQFAFNDCWDFLSKPNYGDLFEEMVRNTIGPRMFTLQMFPILEKPSKSIPIGLLRGLSPMFAGFADIEERIGKTAGDVKRRMDDGIMEESTVFHVLLDAAAEEGNSARMSVRDVADEAMIICGAASDTVGNALMVSVVNVLSDRGLYERVKGELRGRYPDPNEKMRLRDLERLGYLTAVVKEGLRLSYGVIGRLPRMVLKGGLALKGHFLPEGTAVSMSAWMMHRNPDAFPNPDKFDPERWLDPDPEVIRIRERCLVAFSRGNRVCLGMNLAYCELYVTLAMLFRQFDNLVPYEFGVEDLANYCDAFTTGLPSDARRFKIVAGSETIKGEE